MQETEAGTSGEQSEATESPRRIRILGAGRFGAIAARRLSRRYPGSDFLVVDAREEKLREIHAAYNLPVRREDALVSLQTEPVSEDTWIVPAVPVHVAFLWAVAELRRHGECEIVPVPDAVDPQVPNPLRVPGGTVYASFATFKCPDACSEPDSICTYTKKPRPGNLFEVLSQISVAQFRVAVMRSRQLAPGVGGYTGRHLQSMLAALLAGEGAHILATSCRCHGVIDALRWRRAATHAGNPQGEASVSAPG